MNTAARRAIPVGFAKAILRQETLDLYGKVRCDDLTSYVPAGIEERMQRLRDRPGCDALRKSCPSFFQSPTR